MTVLIVDDQEINRAILRHMLDQAGYQCLEACSGAEALVIVSAQPVDLVLLDIVMPGCDGFEVLTKIRKLASELDLPVIMVTATDDPSEVVRSFELGANDFVSKPIDSAVTLARIGTHVKLKTAREALRKSEERYALVAQGTNDGLWDWDLTTNEVYYSPRWMAMLGVDPDEANDSPEMWLGRIHLEDRKRTESELELHLSGSKPHFETELRIRHQDGSYRWMLCRGIAVRNDSGAAQRLAGSLTDITEGKVADALTGLPNRVLFKERINRCVLKHTRDPEYKFALLYLDLDNFKLVNDSLGHDFGDRLLVAISRRLEGSVRICEALVSRLGGDEFAVLLEGISSEQDAVRVAERILKSVSAPISVGKGREIFATLSVGISFCDGASDGAEMLQAADTAMYEAKSRGKSGYQVFNPAMKADATQRLETEHQIRQALESDEFDLHYQPIIDAQSGRLHGFEALSRWNHPDRGLVSPSEFIPIAEETGLIVPIGEWVLHEACRQMVEWKSKNELFSDLVVSVNIASRQLHHPEFYYGICNTLHETGLDPAHLRLEVTESTMMQSEEVSTPLLSCLRELGVKVAIDDFGTGYSSLANLHQLSLDTVKIDRSFVDKMRLSPKNRAIVGTIVTLANRLNFDVVAEGVETVEQFETLRALGCEYVQGFLFSPPVDKLAVPPLVEDHQLCSILDRLHCDVAGAINGSRGQDNLSRRNLILSD